MPASRRPDELTILVVAFVLIAVLTGIAFFVAPVDSSPRTTGSSFSTRADGAKAAYLVLKQLGHPIDRSYDPIAAIVREPVDTVLILASPAEAPSQQDVRALRAFVESGGVVVAYGPSAAPFLPGVKVREHAEPDDKPREFSASLPSALTVEAPMVIARTIEGAELDASFAAVFGSLREPAVVAARLARGRIIWCLDDTPITNEGLARASNVRLMANAAGTPGARHLLWDEHYHGQRRSMWSYFAGTPLPWAGAQLACAAIVVVIASGRRRGPVRARIVVSRTSTLEFVETMASLYERADAQRAALEGARAQLRRQLASASGLPRSAPDQALVKAAGKRLGIDSNRAEAAFASAAELLRHGTARAAETVSVVAELQDVAAAAMRAKTGRTAIREHR